MYIQAYTNNHDKNIHHLSIALSLYQFNHFAFARFNRPYEQEQSTALFAAQSEARRLLPPDPSIK